MNIILLITAILLAIPTALIAIEGRQVMNRISTRLLLLLAIAATISCDRITKHVAVSTLAGSPSRSFLADTLRLEYVENAGAFLSLGATWPGEIRIAVFGIGNGLLLSALVTTAIRLRWPRLALLGVSLFVAGGASNLLDRIVRRETSPVELRRKLVERVLERDGYPL